MSRNNIPRPLAGHVPRTMPNFSAYILYTISVGSNASIVAQHALQHCRLIGEYIATSPDLSKITPLTAFASYLATPVVVALIKFTGLSGHRRKSARSEFRQSLVQISRYIQDTSHILNTLQMIWQPLAPMVSYHGKA
ncbi:hypothetical protein HZ326_25683 [Fusarium oxysporum f. sp. albedinis]|nr:hypothetical protein HZ326_25683 [Fusarium oxysporum f. sp. albedinis]